MRVSLNKIALIEKLLFHANALSPEEKALFETYSILDPDFEQEIAQQRITIDCIQRLGRKALRREIKDVYNELFHPHAKNTLKSKISSLFRN
ncbi:hypothetical protein [Sinomicrobium soli]|uniref:hypothetical protein n=1 Tax=Sinomicrobium sp. N-1-3-6 TaxID=2219864 RepID=UPI0011BFD7A2|nr:hypothetical protein [Sinomicrobium sp. N-1-3-6]